MQKLLQSLMGLVLTLFLIGGAVWGTLAFRPLYYYDVQALSIAADSGYAEADIRANYDALIDYNMAWGEAALALPTLPMSEPGRIHFEEVKAIFDAFKYMTVAGALLLLPWVAYSRRSHQYDWLGIGALCAVVVPAVVGAGVALCWDKAFVFFHELFFNNDYWIFDPFTDPVILILPDTFFLHCALLIVGLVLAGAVVCALLWKRLRKS